MRNNFNNLVEREAARFLASAGLLANAQPHPGPPVAPASAPKAAEGSSSGARDLFFVNHVLRRRGLVETLAQQYRSGPNGVWSGVRVAVHHAQHGAALDLNAA